MAISFPISLPAARTLAVTMRDVNVTSMSKSPFTGQQQVYQHQGQWWEADLTLPKMERADAEPWISALTSLSGMYGTFLFGDPAAASPRGTVSSCVVNGASQTGLTLAVTMTGTLLVGDYIQLGTGATSRLHKVLKDLSGSGTLDIWPRLRESPADAAAVVYNSAKGVFRLPIGNQSFSWDISKIATIQFSAVEAI